MTAAPSGCMATTPYRMTFVDSTTSLDGSSALKYYLNPVTSDSASVKSAAFALSGLEHAIAKCLVSQLP